MGLLLREDHIYFGTFFDLFNLRFAPIQQARNNPGITPPGLWAGQARRQDPGDWLFGGIAEMSELQREFEIFRRDRPFWKCVVLLGCAGLVNNSAKNRYLMALRIIGNGPSDDQAETGDQRIVNAMVTNFAKDSPLPCYLRAHNAEERGNQVIVTDSDRPIFYIDQLYLTISLPLVPNPPPQP